MGKARRKAARERQRTRQVVAGFAFMVISLLFLALPAQPPRPALTPSPTSSLICQLRKDSHPMEATAYETYLYWDSLVHNNLIGPIDQTICKD